MNNTVAGAIALEDSSTHSDHTTIHDSESEQFCTLGKMILKEEAQAILGLIPHINQNFSKACRLLLNRKGGIIVLSIGKYGHIGKKIASTFSSTGNPALFVHAGEARHGDLGMINKNDIVIILSHSGETEEILLVLPTLQHIHAPIITLTSNPHSTLAKAALINLDVSINKEVCPLGLTPTASTIAALAMGDALAIALLQKRGFTETDFAATHPGSVQSRRCFLKVKQIMHTGDAIPKVNEETTLKAAVIEMSRKKLGITTIVNDKNQLMGIFSDGDIRRVLDNDEIDIYNTIIQPLMTKNPKIVHENALVTEALNIMEIYKITALAVISDNNELIGIIHLHDILRAGII